MIYLKYLITLVIVLLALTGCTTQTGEDEEEKEDAGFEFKQEYCVSFQSGLYPEAGNTNNIDGYMRSDLPTYTSGSSDHNLYVGANGPGGAVYRSYIYFFGIETYLLNFYKIKSVYLTLGYYSHGLNLNNIGIHRITGNVPPNDPSWNEIYSGVPWGAPGGDYDSINLVRSISIGNEFVTYELAPSSVQNWLTLLNNRAFLLKATDEATATTRRRFISNDLSPAMWRPKLTVYYTKD